MRENYKNIQINTTKNTHEIVFDLIENKTNSIIADIPCGNGAFVLRLKDYGYSNIYAMDIENNLTIHHNQFLTGDMTKRINLDSNSIDTLVCIDGIEHIDEQSFFVREAKRIIRTGGELILSTPNISSLRSRWRWLMTGHHNKCKSPLDENNPNPLHHIGMVSFQELRYLLHTNGFHITHIKTNRIKFISWIYSLLLPFTYFFTSITYSKTGKKEGTTKINKEIKKAMFSTPILFGESLIIRSIKK